MSRVLFIFTFVLAGCFNSTEKPSVFEGHLYQSMINVTSVGILREEVKSRKIIESPPFTWVPLISFQGDPQGFCLYYRTPFAKEGVLFGKLGLASNCDHVDEGDMRIVLEKVNLKTIKLIKKKIGQYSFGAISLNIDKGKIEAPLPNYRGPEYFKVVLAENELKEREDEYLGQVNQDYSSKEKVLCHDIDKNCQQKIQFQCDQCRYGWYETVRTKCPGGGPKFCGTDKCGQRGMPACPIGFSLLGAGQVQGCFDDSPAGYCDEGLKTYCDENQILICL